MAKRTVTGTAVRNLTVYRDFGLNAVYARFVPLRENQNVSLSNTVRVHMIPLPNGARILDGWVATGSLPTTGGLKVGTTSSLSNFVAYQSIAANQFTRFNVPAGPGTKISLTASDINSYSTVVLTTTLITSASTTVTFGMCVYYTVEDQV